MYTTELTKEVAARTGLTQVYAGKAVKAVFETIVDELVKGGEVRIHNFGAFSVQHKNERTGRDPRSGEKITIAARDSIKFSASKPAKEAVNHKAE